jgi:hypothetical protein
MFVFALEGRFDVAGLEEATIAIPALVADFKAKPFERLQGKCYDRLCDVLYKGSRHWDILICRRMTDLGSSQAKHWSLPGDSGQISPPAIPAKLPPGQNQNPGSDSINSWEVELFISKVNDALKGINSRQRAGCAMMVIKTVVNSWSTTYRYANNGGIRLPCIFGCGGCRDELSHYFACDILWTVVCTASKRDQTWLSAGHFQRIGFKEPGSMNLILCLPQIMDCECTGRQ